MIAIGGFTKAHNALLSLMDLSQRKKCDFRHVVLKRFTEIERNDFSFIMFYLYPPCWNVNVLEANSPTSKGHL